MVCIDFFQIHIKQSITRNLKSGNYDKIFEYTQNFCEIGSPSNFVANAVLSQFNKNITKGKMCPLKIVWILEIDKYFIKIIYYWQGPHSLRNFVFQWYMIPPFFRIDCKYITVIKAQISKKNVLVLMYEIKVYGSYLKT
jgi:hypothetical protein